MYIKWELHPCKTKRRKCIYFIPIFNIGKYESQSAVTGIDT